MKKNFVMAKLGWVVVSVTCVSPYAYVSKMNKSEKQSFFPEIEMLLFSQQTEGSRFLVCVVLKFQHKLSKQLGMAT